MGIFSDGGAGCFCGDGGVKENFRSVGRGTGGVEVSSKRNFQSRDLDCGSTTASIPGKFETVLYRGNREEGGFGSRAPRFGQEQREHELPGPGAHNAPPGLANRGLADNTVGKRGMGPFASKTPRQKAIQSSQAPGPGFYRPSSASGSGPVSARSSSARPMAVFVPPASVNPAKFNARPSPGPCDYSGAIGPGSTSNFNIDNTGAVMLRTGDAESSALSHSAQTATPGPGTYYADRHRSASEDPRRAAMLAKSKFEPPAKAVTEAGLLRLANEVLAEDSAQAKAMPGPGEYDPKPEVTSGGGPVSFGTGESYAFRMGNSHLPRKWKPNGPGPCDYDAPPGSPLGTTAASSFTSKVSRFKEKTALAPGPAYYSPRRRQPDDHDFHLNPHELWK